MSFLSGFKSEMRKIRWARKKEVIGGTLGVLAISAIILVYFFVVDMGIMGIKNIWNGIF